MKGSGVLNTRTKAKMLEEKNRLRADFTKREKCDTIGGDRSNIKPVPFVYPSRREKTMDGTNRLTEILEASLEEVVSAAGFSSDDISDDRVTTALAGVTW